MASKADWYDTEDAQFYAESRERAQKAHEEWKDRIAPVVKHKVEQLIFRGHKIEWFTEWQFRVDGRYDIFWQSKRYHDVKLNKRGDYHDLISFIQSKTHEHQL